jgi:hypothetical protein
MAIAYPSPDTWAAYELSEGERVTGCVERMPTAGAFNGTRLFLRLTDGRVIAIPATASKGHTVLARRLQELCVSADDRITITYFGKRQTVNGDREYRCYEVEAL